jgi:carboxyl-terminal processing protease
VERTLPQRMEEKRERRRIIREEDLKNHMNSGDLQPSDVRPESDKSSERREGLENDNQLARALDVLKSWEILSQMKYVQE